VSLAWYVVLERKIPGFETFLNGKALGHAGEILDSIAREAGVSPLSRFLSISKQALTAFATDHGVDFKELGSLPPEEWFSAEQGLRTLRTLIAAASSRRLSHDIVRDLEDFQAVLQTAEANGVRWHLAVDF
jgi:hypothetical protein